MSQFTYSSWQDFVAELRESHDKHNCSTRDPIWMVQKLQKTWGMSSDYSDSFKWVVDGEYKYETAQKLFDGLDARGRHEVNEFCLKESDVLFDDLDGDESSQDELLEKFASESDYDWSKVYYTEDWVTIQAFLTQQDANRFIERHNHNYKKLRVYVESTWRSPHLKNLIQAVLDGELKLVKGGEA
ncbi:hypothetical protein [Acinetobacter ursingii]|uniref:hypothetical protein n=1 Tax=Acinetobacter ursingii TaxID=108980 RepID=UPI003AF52629